MEENKNNGLTPEEETAAVSDDMTAVEEPDINEILLGDKKPKKEKQHRFRKAMRSQKFRYGSISTLITVVAIVAVVLLNVLFGVLADKFPMTVDLTNEKLFSFSEQAQKVADSLDTPVDIVVFTAESFFKSPSTGTEEYDTILRQFYTTLSEYKAHANNKITYRFIDLDNNPTLAKQYSRYDVSGGDILFIAKNVTDDATDGTGRYRKISANDLVSTDTDSNTYETIYTSKVDAAVGTALTAVGTNANLVLTILTGHSENETMNEQLKAIYESAGYTVLTADIAAGNKIEDGTTAVIINAPMTDYTDAEIEYLRGWLSNDGKQNRHLAVFANFLGTCPKLYEFLNEDYGIEVTDNLIYQNNASLIPSYYNSPVASTATVEKTDFTKESGGKTALMAYSLQIRTHEDNNTENPLYNVDLITFSNTAKVCALTESWKQSTYENDENDENAEDPTPTDADEYPLTAMAYAVNWNDAADGTEGTCQTSVLVCGSYSLPYTNTTSNSNALLLTDTMNGLTGNKSLVSFPSNILNSATLSYSSLTATVLGLGVFTLGLPVLLLGIGMAVFIRRKRL